MKIVYALAKNLGFMIYDPPRCRGVVGRASALGAFPNAHRCPGSLANPSKLDIRYRHQPREFRPNALGRGSNLGRDISNLLTFQKLFKP